MRCESGGIALFRRFLRKVRRAVVVESEAGELFDRLVFGGFRAGRCDGIWRAVHGLGNFIRGDPRDGPA